MSQGIHCDGPACTSWARPDVAEQKGFLTVFGGIYPNYTVINFCSWSCCMRYSSLKESSDVA